MSVLGSLLPFLAFLAFFFVKLLVDADACSSFGAGTDGGDAPSFFAADLCSCCGVTISSSFAKLFWRSAKI